MPRLTHTLIRRAWAVDPLLPLLLRPCRDLGDAQNELRWLREFAFQRPGSVASQQHRLNRLCHARSLGKPLQYLLGNQPFGDLDIHCRPGVLIPRPETESYTIFLAQYLQSLFVSPEPRELRILDLCTGTGCIALLLYSLLAKTDRKIRVRGVDISNIALRLAQKNLESNVRQDVLGKDALDNVDFHYGDVLNDDTLGVEGWDVVVSNPPYISQSSFLRDTSRSARLFEPRLALVPPGNDPRTVEDVDISGDIFYAQIVKTAYRAKAKLIIMEVAGNKQAERIGRQLAATDLVDKTWCKMAIWRDNLYNLRPDHAFDQAANEKEFYRAGLGAGRALVLADTNM